ncbi:MULTISPECIES: GNAT family N-acetyltransferase [Streptomyces]|uniref:Ribosomal-protein-serine acetyltransferase n=2 Tax=Streptomyces TaxID=1883 RepID=A0A1I6QRA1_9ACTN|nr:MULTISPECIES: GNAT family N-acetyltransferase [Streptomyces]SFS55007.1 ribosomal-protein-serine acetyltransferase [Streptomyces harbinensis]
MLESPPPKQLVPDLPTLVPGLALRELTVKDADAYYKLLDNNRRHLTRLGDYQAEGNATSAWVREHLSTDPGQSLRYGIRLKGELIGRVDLTAADPPRYGTGYWLGEAYVGKGYAMAACAPLYDYAARKLRATDIFAGVTHGNARSVALLKRLGFEPVTEFENYTRFHLSLVQ